MRAVVIYAFVIRLGVLVHSKGCSLPVEVYREENMPVLVDNSTSKFQLVLPDNGKIDLVTGGKITLVCPNPRNTLEITHTNSTLASCVKGETIKVLKTNVNFQNVSCSMGVRGTAVSTNKECGGGAGYIIKLGFPAGRKEFLTLIEVCYDSDNGNTLYASHTLIGKEIDFASKSNFRPGFSTAELAPGVSANIAYKQVIEKATFNKLLGSAKLAEKYINTNSYLARGHLAPDADFLFASWQYATYFYVNAVPQWQQINNGNWKKLEGISRNAASYYNEDLQVYTGTHKVLSLPNTKNVSTRIYLVSGKKLAVPNFVWKILYSKKSHKAIAFVSLNNPFVSKLKTSDKLCTNICDRYGWDNPAWSNRAKGFVYCCDARDLLGVVGTGPNLKIRGTLEAPSVSPRFGLYEYSTDTSF